MSTCIAVVSMGMVSIVNPAQAVNEHHHCVVDTSDSRVTCYGILAVAIAEATGDLATNTRSARPARWREMNASHLVGLVRAGATFVNDVLVERPDDEEAV